MTARRLRVFSIIVADGGEVVSAAPPSSTLMENAQSRLAVTHPSRKPTFSASAQGEAG